MDINPIETTYKGYKFRSRLEARWAVFFDEIGIEWEYEKEGFKNDEGDFYLPDFYLPESKTWVEVKGDKDYFLHKEDHKKMVRLLDYGGVLPDFAWSGGKQHSTRGLLLLGNIPEPREDGHYIFPIIQHDKGLERQWVMFIGLEDRIKINGKFTPTGFNKSHLINVSKNNLYHDNYLFFLTIPQEIMFDVSVDTALEGSSYYWKVENRFILTDGGYVGQEILFSAFQKARSARFEHGEV